MKTILEPPRHTAVLEQTDVCVLGGSCTGVFAAIRAARLGAKVVLVEKQNCLGGAATCAMVNTWPTLMDSTGTQQINAGLTQELIDRMDKRGSIMIKPSGGAIFVFNTEEMKIELDEMLLEAGVTPYLHAQYVAPVTDGERITAVLIETKSGRYAIEAGFFIDATGDGDLCNHLGLCYIHRDALQPPTMGAKLHGLDSVGIGDFRTAFRQYGHLFGLKEDKGWGGSSACVPGLTFHAETHVMNVNCADAKELTYAEMEGRRQIRAMLDAVAAHGPKNSRVTLAQLGSYIGIRETRHMHALYRLTEADLLGGVSFPDAIANGTRQVDIHHHDKPGLTFRFLDGREVYSGVNGPVEGRWRPEGPTPRCWQIPYRCLVPQRYENLLSCGRMVDADSGAFGAIRLMVSTNQMGEAAGVAAALCLSGNCSAQALNTDLLRDTLEKGGSVVLR